MNESLDNLIKQHLTNAHHILITTHIRPDGDAIGSLLGLGLSLQASGKDVQMVMQQEVSSAFRFLEGYDQIVQKAVGVSDLIIVLDSGDISRIGYQVNERVVDINIDHHITNARFAHINLVEDDAVSTTAILAEHLPAWGLKINSSVAQALLSGLVSDTIGFRTPNVTPQTMRLAADLMEKGADLSFVYNQALVQRSYEATQYWGFGLSRLQRQGNVIWTTLSLEDRANAKYPGNDDADLINFLSTIEDVDIALIFVEQKHGEVKVSWRTTPGFDVTQIAVQFNGGGHPAAAGATITGNLDEVQQKVLKATIGYLTDLPERAELLTPLKDE